ncbi:hypothetical protein HMPREF3037_03261, partial [Candidatus Stoquefichus sp. KLE1796]
NLTRNWNVNPKDTDLMISNPPVYNLTRNWNVNPTVIATHQWSYDVYNLTKNWNVNSNIQDIKLNENEYII